MNLGVVADVHGEARMKIESLDRRRVGVLQRERAEFAGDAAAGAGIGQVELDDHGGVLLSARAETDERAAPRVGIRAEDAFAWLGVQRAGRGLDALGLSPAKPKIIFGIEIAAIAHAVPDGGGAAGLRVES